MKTFLIEYVVIPNGATHFYMMDAKGKKAAKNIFEETYSPDKIKSIKSVDKDEYII